MVFSSTVSCTGTIVGQLPSTGPCAGGGAGGGAGAGPWAGMEGGGTRRWSVRPAWQEVVLGGLGLTQGKAHGAGRLGLDRARRTRTSDTGPCTKALTKLRAMSTLSSRKTVSSRAASSVSSFFFFRWAAWYSRCRCLRSASERFDPRTSSGGGAAAPTVGASEPKVAAIRHKRDPMRNHNAVQSHARSHMRLLWLRPSAQGKAH